MSSQIKDFLRRNEIFGDHYAYDNQPLNGSEFYNTVLVWSDFVWGYLHSRKMQESLTECDIDFEDLSLEVFCDRDCCEMILRHMSEIAQEAAMMSDDMCLKINSIEIGCDDSDSLEDSATYVVTITADWHMTIERYVDECVPRHSGTIVVANFEGDIRRLIHKDVLEVLQVIDAMTDEELLDDDPTEYTGDFSELK